MDKVLFVIDMQEIYLGRGRNKAKYPYDAENLVDSVNKRIAEYKPEEIFYFRSIAKGLGNFIGSLPKAGTHEAKFVERLKVVSKNIYDRSKPDVFANSEIVDLMRSRYVKEIELVGVDGAGSIAQSAITCTNDVGITIVYNHGCIGSVDPDKAFKMQEKFRSSKIVYFN